MARLAILNTVSLCRVQSSLPSLPFVSTSYLYISEADPVVADGYQLKLIDPYNRPTLYVRRPGSDVEEVHMFHNDDPFFSEMSTFIDTVEGQNPEIPVLSSYADGE
jgi:hypothetical protein